MYDDEQPADDITPSRVDHNPMYWVQQEANRVMNLIRSLKSCEEVDKKYAEEAERNAVASIRAMFKAIHDKTHS